MAPWATKQSATGFLDSFRSDQCMQTIAITQGDSAGIGPEIVAKAFRDAAAELHGCFVVGDVASLRRAAQALVRPGMPGVPVAQISAPAQALKMPPRCVPVLQLPSIPGPPPWGEGSAAAGRAGGDSGGWGGRAGLRGGGGGRAAADSVVWAARAALRGEVAAIVTAPLHKAALAAAGVGFAGHTELLQAEAAAYQGLALERMPVRMMLANAELRTVLVSIHVSLRAAIAALTFGQLLQTLQITHAALTRSLGHAPRIAVAGLNPHAGEGGLFGREELEVIAPAIAAARAQGMQVHGPFAPDTVFMRAR